MYYSLKTLLWTEEQNVLNQTTVVNIRITSVWWLLKYSVNFIADLCCLFITVQGRLGRKKFFFKKRRRVLFVSTNIINLCGKPKNIYPTENGQHPCRLVLRYLTQPLPLLCGHWTVDTGQYTSNYTTVPVRLYTRNCQQSRREEVVWGISTQDDKWLLSVLSRIYIYCGKPTLSNEDWCLWASIVLLNWCSFCYQGQPPSY